MKGIDLLVTPPLGIRSARRVLWHHDVGIGKVAEMDLLIVVPLFEQTILWRN